MITPTLQTQLQNAVDQLFDQQVDFLKRLVEFPSLRGEEAPLQDYLAATWRAAGLCGRPVAAE
jgi:acetylornithine deacetylase